MTIHLPSPIAGYFEADEAGNAEAVAAWFTEDAILTDEGKENRGRDAVRAWKTSSSKAYNYTVEPFAVVSEGNQTIVTGHVVGNFPGSPVDLRFLFSLDGGKIAALEIVS